MSFDVQRRPLATTIWPKVSTVSRLTNLPSRIIQPRLQGNGRGRCRLGSTPGPPSRLQTMGPGPVRVSQVSAKPASRPAHDPPSLMQPPPPPANGGPVRKERTHHEPQRRGRRGPVCLAAPWKHLRRELETGLLRRQKHQVVRGESESGVKRSNRTRLARPQARTPGTGFSPWLQSKLRERGDPGVPRPCGHAPAG